MMGLLLLLGAAAWGTVALGQAELVLYSSGLALVTETRVLPLAEEGALALSGFPAETLWETLTAEGLEVLALRPLPSQTWSLARLLGQEITVQTELGPVRGILREIAAEGLVLESEEGLVIVREYQAIQGPKYEPPPKTQAILYYRAPEPGQKGVRFRYLARGFSWNVTYDAELMGENLEILAKAVISNDAGVDFPQAKVTLVAGEIRAPAKEAGVRALALAPGAGPSKAFEYYRYDLPGTWDVLRGDVTLALFSSFVPATKLYRFAGNGVEIHLIFIADSVLPAGEMRVYAEGIFAGASAIPHTPAGKEVDLWVGNAFDLKGERVQVAQERLGEDLFRGTWRITLWSTKGEDVEVEVIEALPGYWRILSSTFPYEVLDAGRVKFVVPVPKGGETSLEYTVEWHY